MRFLLVLAIALGLLGAGSAQDAAPAKSGSTSARQKQADRDITAKIRRSIIDDRSLSTSAHNVNIRTQNGKVTLRGNVASEEEKHTVESKAKEVAGPENVTSELAVAPSKKKTG